jgi:hypothetical protein
MSRFPGTMSRLPALSAPFVRYAKELGHDRGRIYCLRRRARSTLRPRAGPSVAAAANPVAVDGDAVAAVAPDNPRNVRRDRARFGGTCACVPARPSIEPIEHVRQVPVPRPSVRNHTIVGAMKLENRNRPGRMAPAAKRIVRSGDGCDGHDEIGGFAREFRCQAAAVRFPRCENALWIDA